MTPPKPETRIIQRGSGHAYSLDGQKVPRVTRIIGDGVPKPALVGWAAKESGQYVLDHWPELEAMSPSERFEAVRDARYTTLRAAGDRGREVHALLHRYVLNEPVEPPEDLAGHFDAGCRFVDEWRLREVAIEVAVFHRPAPEVGRPHPYAGRFDLLGHLVDGRLWLLDFKTSLKGVYPEYALQLAAYRYADFYVLDGQVDAAGLAVEHPMPAVDAAGVIWLRDDGSYELVPITADYRALEAFTAACELAGFATSDRGEWIGSALRPPEPEEAAA